MKRNHTGRKALALLLALCMAVLLLPVSASALEDYYTGEHYSLWREQSSYNLIIYENEGWTEWKTAGVSPLLVNSVDIRGSRVTEIPERALERMAITSLEIPDSVHTVGARAFSGTRLGDVSLPGNLKAFAPDAFAGVYGPKITLRMSANANTLLSSSSYQYGGTKIDLSAPIREIVLSGSGSLTVPSEYPSETLPKLTVKNGATLRIGKKMGSLSLTAETGANVWNDTKEPVVIEGISVPPGVNYAGCMRITEQPKDVTMVWDPRSRAAFQVKVSDNASGVSYQWYRKLNYGDDGWKPLSGETTNEYEQDLDDATMPYDSYYKCVVTQTFQTSSGAQKLVLETREAELSLTDYVDVTDISYTQGTVHAGRPVKLTGSVEPSNATVKEIQWSVAMNDSGETGAVIKNNELTAARPGTVKLQAMVTNGLLTDNGWDFFYGDYKKEFEVTVGPAFVPVTSVEAPPEIVSYDTDTVILPTEVFPGNATNSTVKWRITGTDLQREGSSSYASASIQDGNKLKFDYGAAGRISLKATVAGGGWSGSSPRDYQENFIVIVGDYPRSSQTNCSVRTLEGQSPSEFYTAYYYGGGREDLTCEWQFFDTETSQWKPAAGRNQERFYQIPKGSYGVDEAGKATADIAGYRFRCVTKFAGMQLPVENFQYDLTFTNVTDITGCVSKMCVNTETNFGARVSPGSASATKIDYEIVSKNPSTMGTALSDRALTCWAPGTVTIKMTVKNGVKNSDGTFSDYSKNETIQVYNNAPTLTSDLAKDIYIREGTTLSLKIGVSDPGVSYQWYVSKDGGVTWMIPDTLTWTKAASYSVFSEDFQDGWMYKCEAANGAGTTTSNECTVYVKPRFEKVEVSGLPSTLAVGKTYRVTAKVVPEDSFLYTDQSNAGVAPYTLDWRVWGNSFTVKATGEPNTWDITPAEKGTNKLIQLRVAQNGLWVDVPYYENVTLEAPESAAVKARSRESANLELAELAELSELTVSQYEPVRLSVSCEGEQLRYQWQSSKDGATWSDIGNASAASYTVPTQTADPEGTWYRCVVSNDAGEVKSNAIQVVVEAVEAAPAVLITEHPEPMSTLEGNGVLFGVTAQGKDLAYQWQQSADAGETWTNLQGETTDLLILSATADRNGYQFRCAVTGTGEDGQSVTLTSDAAALLVESYATVEAVAPDFTEFSLNTANPVSGTAQWNNGAETKDILWFLVDDGGTEAVLTQENQLTAKNEGTVTLMAIVNNGSDPYNPYLQEFTVPVATDPAKTPPTVYSKEDSELTLAQGRQTYLLAAAEPAAGEELTYQWQSSTDQINWANLEGEVSSDYQTPPAEAGKTVSYRCKVSNEYGFAFTGIYTVEGTAAKPVTDITLSLNELKAGGEPVYLSSYATIVPGDASYQNIQWAISNAGETGARFDKYGCLAAEKAGTVVLTATIKNGNLPGNPGDFNKEIHVTVTESAAPKILSQPKDLTVPEGSRAVFMVWTSGAGVEYQWQRRGSETEEWQDLEDGTATAVYEIPQVSRSDNGSQFRCVLSNASPETVTTDTATLTVAPNGSSGGGGSTEPGPDDEPKDLPFTDVSKKDWFYDSVNYVYEEGLFHGTSETAFSPDGKMTRGMAVTVLYRMAGSPAPEGGLDSPFVDVDPNAYYAAAVYWARANGVMMGTGDDSFAPDGSLTREQLAATLYRFAGSPEVTGTLDRFTDGASASKYAEQALCWAVEQGILTGKGGGVLDPKGTAKRCEIAAMVTRYCLLEL